MCRRHTSSKLRTICSLGRMKRTYIMNRMKREKSVLRKKGDVYVLDLFVRVPPSVPMEVDAINQVADGRERGKRVTFHCNSSTF